MGQKMTIPGTKNLSVQIMTVTPQVAKELLKGNRHNRTLRRGHIFYLASNMRKDEWELAQPLLISKDGRLLDGQHRLRAVIESNVPCDFITIKGFDYNRVFGKLDDTARRTVADWLHQSGVANPTIVAAVVRMCHNELSGRNPFSKSNRNKLSGPGALAFLEMYPEIEEACASGPGTINTLLPRSMCCYLYLKFRNSDPKLADLFFVDLVEGKRKGEGDPVWLLRDRILRDREAKERLGDIQKAALIIKAWNAEKNDEPLHHLRWINKGDRPEKFPAIV